MRQKDAKTYEMTDKKKKSTDGQINAQMSNTVYLSLGHCSHSMSDVWATENRESERDAQRDSRFYDVCFYTHKKRETRLFGLKENVILQARGWNTAQNKHINNISYIYCFSSEIKYQISFNSEFTLQEQITPPPSISSNQSAIISFLLRLCLSIFFCSFMPRTSICSQTPKLPESWSPKAELHLDKKV